MELKEEEQRIGNSGPSLAPRSTSYTARTRSDGKRNTSHTPPTKTAVVSDPRDRHGNRLQQAQAQRNAYKNTADSWVEIASQPSSSSLSSAADEIVTTGLTIQQTHLGRRRRRLRSGAPTHLSIISRPSSLGEASSQEEYEESESESDRVLTSSNEDLFLRTAPVPLKSALDSSSGATDDEDENRTAINQPTNEHCFTPQPNAFSHPLSSHAVRNGSEPVPGSYFPRAAARPGPRSTIRHSYPSNDDARVQHSPFNITSPSQIAAANHDAALRASLSTLLSCAAAARGLSKQNQQQTSLVHARPSTRIETNTLRLVPESELLGTPARAQQFAEPTFHPTIRRKSTSSSTSAQSRPTDASRDTKRKVTGRSSSKDRHITKKARRATSSYYPDELMVSPTLLTWIVSAGVVVVLSAISFSAGYSIGKEAGRLEAVGFGSGSEMNGCAREAGRSGLGLRRLRFATKA
jgi:hypothetical protein